MGHTYEHASAKQLEPIPSCRCNSEVGEIGQEVEPEHGQQAEGGHNREDAGHEA